MSLRLEMLKAASRAPLVLGDSADLVLKFLLSQQNPDGGFKNRAGQSDLYYMPFALGALGAVSGPNSKQGQPLPELQRCVLGAIQYLIIVGEGKDLDFVHVCSLARSWAAVREFAPGSACASIFASVLGRLELHRTLDGGYNPARGSSSGSAYGAFLALGAYQDLQAEVPNAMALGQSLLRLQTMEGGYANQIYPYAAGVSTEIGSPVETPASTNASAAAIAVLNELNLHVNHRAADWLLARLHPSGGFLASSTAPAPDLLSTATALDALANLGVPLSPFKERSLDFVDSLWTNKGAFFGHWEDDHPDCEYTFYGLLALGHLQGT